MMMRRPAPFDPPMMATTRLGAMAMERVIKFLIHVFILMSRNPYTKERTVKLCFKIYHMVESD